jgi:hypothetical protein
VAMTLERQGYVRMPEISEEIDPLAFPSFSLDVSAMREADAWFLDKEVQRCSRLHNLLTENIVMERGFYSMKSVAYAREKLFGVKDPFLDTMIAQALAAGQLLEPELIILDAPLDMLMQRAYDRYCSEETMQKLRITPEFLAAQQEFYQCLAREKGCGIYRAEEFVWNLQTS